MIDECGFMDLGVQNILGVGISKLAIQSRKDLIDVWLLIVGF